MYFLVQLYCKFHASYDNYYYCWPCLQLTSLYCLCFCDLTCDMLNRLLVCLNTGCRPVARGKKGKTGSYMAPLTERSQTIPALAFTHMCEACSHTWRVEVLPRDTGTQVSQRPTTQSRQARSWSGRGSDVTNAFCPICILWRTAAAISDRSPTP